jgi:hypothetical protein
MNAYDLADRLEQFYTGTHIQKAAEELRQQQAEIDALKKFIAESKALDKKLFESIKKSEEMWNKAAKSILMKAQKK